MPVPFTKRWVGCFVLFGCMAAYAQPYVEGGKTRHRFAQLNAGVDGRFFTGNGSRSARMNTAGQLQPFELNDHLESRIIIGGTHFWGHADFYVCIPVISSKKSGFSTGAETGAKYFPWRLEHNKIRPYVGIALLNTQFQQDSGTYLVRFKYPVLAGVVFNYKKHLMELGVGYNYNNSDTYYISQTNSTQVKTQPFWISLGYKLMLETTGSAEHDWQNGKTKRLTDTLSTLNRLNGLTLAVGPSSAFFLKSSEHTKQVAPYADDHKATVFPEFGIGYYWHKPDLQLNVSYRGMKSRLTAYDFSQVAKRKALVAEGYHFFADYHGFAVFAGAAASYEWLQINETKNHINTSGKYEGLKPGLVLGWDIRPNRLQAWYLRTHLRYFPNLAVKMATGKTVPFDQLEFNFIQLVVFPGRMF